jgi:hypothetical protein
VRALDAVDGVAEEVDALALHEIGGTEDLELVVPGSFDGVAGKPAQLRMNFRRGAKLAYAHPERQLSRVPVRKGRGNAAVQPRASQPERTDTGLATLRAQNW